MAKRTRNSGMTEIEIVICAFARDTSAVEGPFVPSTQQALALENFPKKTIEDWWHFMHHDAIENALWYGHDTKESLKIRTEYIAKMMIQGDGTLRHIVFLDGHGRTLLLLIDALLEKGVPFSAMDNVFTVVEQTEGGQMWHERFFPQGISCIYGDIFGVIDGTYEPPDESPVTSPVGLFDEESDDEDCTSAPMEEEKLPIPVVDDTTVVYLNFCGIAKALTQTCLCLYERPSKTTVVSYSYSRAARVDGCAVHEFHGIMSECELVDDRDGIFYTYCV